VPADALLLAGTAIVEEAVLTGATPAARCCDTPEALRLSSSSAQRHGAVNQNFTAEDVK